MDASPLWITPCSWPTGPIVPPGSSGGTRSPPPGEDCSHDLYLYDSRISLLIPACSASTTPAAAARNAAELTALSDKERNIILSHMWPLGGQLPRSREAWLVDLVDTFCAALELARIYHPGRLREQMGVEPLLEKGEPMARPLLTDI